MGNLILFGAGASFGSDADNRYTPPLGGDLFDALCRFGSQSWGAVPQQFANLFRGDFEQGMREFALSYGGANVDILQRAMAGYFFQFRPRQQSLYHRLARCAKQTGWDGAFATLNYERLLELALTAEAVQPRVGSPSQPPGAIELCLPHGCCHIFGMIRAHNISASSGVTFDGGRVEVVDNPQKFSARLLNDVIPPVMSYFEPQKKTRSGVSFIKRQRDRYSRLVGEAEVVGVVGVRVRPHDAHIWEALRETRARIVYCAGESGAEEFQAWAEASGRRGDQVLSNYWTEGFDDICSAVGIREHRGQGT